MPNRYTRDLTLLQIAVLRGVADGTIKSEWKRIGDRHFIRHVLPDGHDVSSQIKSLRKRKYLRWVPIDADPPRSRTAVTEEGTAYLERIDQCRNTTSGVMGT